MQWYRSQLFGFMAISHLEGEEGGLDSRVLYSTSKKDTLYTGLYTIVTCIYLDGV
jgi:hypothetical protein